MGGVLLVCTANQIRSPMAERLLVQGLTRKFGPVADSVVVMSAGLQVVGTMPMHPYAQAELTRMGVPADGHKSMAFDPDVAGRAHLVLTATREHRDQVITLVPGALPYTFTLRELARLLEGLGPSDLPGKHLAVRVFRLHEVLQPRRGLLAGVPPESLDIDDPIGGGRQDYRRAAAEIDAALQPLIAVL